MKIVLPNADFVIEGCVEECEALRDEGPFNNRFLPFLCAGTPQPMKLALKLVPPRPMLQASAYESSRRLSRGRHD